MKSLVRHFSLFVWLGFTASVFAQLGGSLVAPTGVTGGPYQPSSEKGAANGYAPLGSDSKVPSANLPSASAGSTNNIPALRVSNYATGGDGTAGNPWTGWDTNTPWANYKRFDFTPNEYFRYTNTLDLSYKFITVDFNDAFIVFAPTSPKVGIKIDGGATGLQFIDNPILRNLNFSGNANTTDAIYFRLMERGTIDRAKLKNFTGAGLRAVWMVGGLINDFHVSHLEDPMTTLPAQGIVLTNRGTGEYSTCAVIVRPVIEGLAGGTDVYGLDLNYAVNCIVQSGTVENSNGGGIRLGSQSRYNTIIAMDNEVNTGGRDFLIEGDYNTLMDCIGPSNGLSLTGTENKVIGGTFGAFGSGGTRTIYMNANTSIPTPAGQSGKVLSNNGEYLQWITPSSGGSSTVIPGVCNFRLTTESNTPVSSSDRTAQSTLYLTPYKGNHVSLYSGSAWVDRTSAQISLALNSLTSGKNYDVFLYDNAGTVAAELTAWTNDSTRATALTTQDGVYCKTGALTRLYVGTIRTTGTSTTEDSAAKRFVWNYYNRSTRAAKKSDSTQVTLTNNNYSWAYWNGNSGNKTEFILGLPEESTRVSVNGTFNASRNGGSGYADGTGYVLAGVDDLINNGPNVQAQASGTSYTSFRSSSVADTTLSAGYHYATVAYGTSGTAVVDFYFGEVTVAVAN